MLTLELDGGSGVLCIHGNPAGLRSLCEIIERLIARTPNGKFEHTHLMTPEWGGSELTSEPLGDEESLVQHHVKLYCWKGAEPAT